MKKKMTYKKAGVNIDTTNHMVRDIKKVCARTYRKEVLGKIGSFSGFCSLPRKKMKEPVLAGATDGVGTKILIAQTRGEYRTIGIDLVAMCVNDIVTSGAEPLFFLDYYATGKVKPAHFNNVLYGIAKGCTIAGCALIGGEIAEMPDCYSHDAYDLAGFCVGVVDKEDIIDGRNIRANDVIIGLPSSGLHSNGYSLARKLFTKREIRSSKWGAQLLRPTKIYVKQILKLIREVPCNTIAHITGGGFYDNIPRVVPYGYTAVIKQGSWRIPLIFKEMARRGNITDHEMFKTFNMGIGMIVVVKQKHSKKALSVLSRYGITSYIIGHIERGKKEIIIR